MRGTVLCHSLCRETKKGALIDRRSLSIPLRGRALCEAWAEYCLQFLSGTSPIFWQIYFTCRISAKTAYGKERGVFGDLSLLGQDNRAEQGEICHCGCCVPHRGETL